MVRQPIRTLENKEDNSPYMTRESIVILFFFPAQGKNIPAKRLSFSYMGLRTV